WQSVCHRFEQRGFAIAEEQAVETDLAQEMAGGWRATGIGGEPGRAGQGRGPLMRVRAERKQERCYRRGCGDRNGQPDRPLHQLADEGAWSREGWAQHRTTDQEEHVDGGVSVKQDTEWGPGVFCGVGHKSGNEV